MNSLRKENLMEHTAETSIIAHALGVINNTVFKGNASIQKILEISLYHDSSEVLTGDLPTPVKYHNKEISTQFKALESVANKKLLSMLPSEISDTYSNILEPQRDSYEYQLVKAADRISALIKCLDELKGGNSEFANALKSIKEKLDDCELQEVKYFMKNFANGFNLTLDELDSNSQK